MKQKMKHLIYFIILVLFDQGTKFWIKATVMNEEAIVIIPKILKLQYHQNSGAVWGILPDKAGYLSIFTFIIMAGIIFVYTKIPEGKKYNALKLLVVFILAGAVGNLIDRISLGYVVDFIYIEIINFPLFNVADTYLTFSSIILLLLAIFYYKDDDFVFLDQLFKKKKKQEDTKEEGSLSTNSENELDNNAENEVDDKSKFASDNKEEEKKS
ncbi:MAG: signal peptidase II [Mobilitalea sp.]